jgi:hypothetical protein
MPRKIDFAKLDGREPLLEYPWHPEIDRLLSWAKEKTSNVHAFCFDVVMSLAYVDATAGIEQNIEFCKNAPTPYNAHMGFINLCAPCYENEQKWGYQKAAKPQSGALGKLSCEIILRFVSKLSSNIQQVIAIGGTETADAILIHRDGTIVLAEVKSAPLVTYPMVLRCNDDFVNSHKPHDKIVITSSQFRDCESAIYLHNKGYIPLGKPKDNFWPFKAAVDFIVDEKNANKISEFIATWLNARDAYKSKDKNNKYYYLSDASGGPPKIAKDLHKWPAKESISDSKTSAGMDRTDDIKKGIYQVLKIGSFYKDAADIKTALISNLPAYRHGDDYVSPFIDMLWGYEADVENIGTKQVIARSNLKRVFDYIITLEESVLRDFKL